MDEITAQLDREVARAVAAWRSAEAALRRGGPEEAWNALEGARRVSSRATFLELTGRAPGIGADFGIAPSSPAAPPDALALAVASWVRALTLERVLFADRVRLAAAWRAPSVVIEGFGEGAAGAGRATPLEARAALLAEAGDAPRRAWAEALARGAGAVADASRMLVERREEATRRLGAEGDPPPGIPVDPPDAALRAAGALLERTAPMLERAPAWDAAIGRAIARDAAAGWPARLGPRWIEELFRPTGLTDGLAIELGPLPRALGASSFARALSRFGDALARASAPGAAPFSLAHPPVDLRRARRGAVRGLVADPVFCARALGLGRGAAADQARATARALVVSLRLDAARLRLEAGPAGHVLLMGARARADRFEEETALALGAPIPGALAGVVPELDGGAAARLAGALLAARDRRALVERFDEDWFRNPQAAEAIRGEDAVLPPSPRVAAAELEAGLEALGRALEALA